MTLLSVLEKINKEEAPDGVYNLLSTAKCIFEPNPLIGIVEFKFNNISLIHKLKFTGDIDLVVEVFLNNYKESGYKVHTFQQKIQGTDVELDLDNVLGDHIIIRKENTKEALKIKMLQVMGRDCIKQNLISDSNYGNLLKEKLGNKDIYKDKHITKDNICNFRLGDIIYLDKECLERGTLDGIEHLLILQALCLRSNKKLILNKCWLHDFFEIDPNEKNSIYLTADEDVLEELTFEVITEGDANLRMSASHLMKLYNNVSHSALASQRFVETLNMLMKRRLKLKENIVDKIAHRIKDNLHDFKNTYGIFYKGTDSANNVGGVNVHFDYNLIERYLRNSLSNSYEDMKTVRLYVSSDEQPFVDFMKEKFGDVVIESDTPKYDIKTSGLRFMEAGDIKEVISKKIDQVPIIAKDYSHEKTLIDIYMLSRCNIVLLTHGKECEFVQIFKDNIREGIVKLNPELSKISGR